MRLTAFGHHIQREIAIKTMDYAIKPGEIITGQSPGFRSRLLNYLEVLRREGKPRRYSMPLDCVLTNACHWRNICHISYNVSWRRQWMDLDPMSGPGMARREDRLTALGEDSG